NQIELILRLGQSVGLTVFVELKPVLEMAKELICRRKPRVFEPGEEFLVTQPRKSEQRTTVTHPRLASAVQALEALHEEFDVANTALRKLHIDPVLGSAALFFVDA